MAKYVHVQVSNLNIKATQIKHNLEEHRSTMLEAYADGVKILLFPTFSLCGTGLASYYSYPGLIQAQEEAVVSLVEASKSMPDLLTAIGISFHFQARFYIGHALILNGTLVAIIPQEYINEENRYIYKDLSAWNLDTQYDQFAGLDTVYTNQPIRCDHNGQKMTLALISADAISLHNPRFMQGSRTQVDLLLLPDASPKLQDSYFERRDLAQSISKLLHAAVMYTNASYSNSGSDYIYAGEQFLIEDGEIIAEDRSSFDKQGRHAQSLFDLSYLAFMRTRSLQPITTQDMPSDKPLVSISQAWMAKEPLIQNFRKITPYPFVPDNFQKRAQMAEDTLQIQAAGLAKRLEAIHADKLVLGVSGGLDSTLALLVCIRAMALLNKSASNILAIELPGYGTSDETSTNAEKLITALGVERRKISIIPAVNQHFKDINHDPEIHDHTYENAQARERTQILMNIANKENGIVVGTGDLSELALGWCTYNADQMSMYSVNHSIPKTLIRPLLQHEAMLFSQNNKSDLAAVLSAISKTAVSPELLPPNPDGEIQQKTEDLIGPYVLHDFFLYHFLACGRSFPDIYNLALIAFSRENRLAKEYFSPSKIKETLLTFVKRFFQQQFKRIPSPDGISVSRLNLSPRGSYHLAGDINPAELLEEIKKL